MNSSVISKNLMLGVLMSSLFIIMGAFSPLAADASVNTGNASSTKATSTKEVKMKKNKSAVNLTCMQTAVDTREDVLAEAYSNFSEEMTDGLKDRKTALHDAWGMTDKSARLKALKTAWADWKAVKKAAHAEFKTEKKAAWDTFKATAKTTCKEVLPKEEGLEKDTAGSVSI